MSEQFAVIVSPQGAVRLLNVTTNEVADLAVIEDSWRALGDDLPAAETPADDDVEGFAFTPYASYGQFQLFSFSYLNATRFRLPAVACDVA